ncbi:hypothetical protein [Rhodospirillaceae bacterium SYSU D60014]|uniref:hypothetical protein n=1 Tax=Virgifigura deserti TaxID=2268457 RepID=UPI000E669BD3
MDGTIRSWMVRLWPALLLAVAGCSYRGNIDKPIARRLTWFSYIGGDDIRAACGPGMLDWYRLVYNARYEEQLRTYEVVADGAGGAILVARVLGSTAPLHVVGAPLSPWRWARSEARLDEATFAAFEQTMVDSGFFEPLPVGLRLFSGDFWWVATGCIDEAFHFGAWRYTPDHAADLDFPAFLFVHDATGVPVNPPPARYQRAFRSARVVLNPFRCAALHKFNLILS